jgi:hypothetical protein
MRAAEMPFCVDSIRAEWIGPIELGQAITVKVRIWPEALLSETNCIHCLQVSGQDRDEIKKGHLCTTLILKRFELSTMFTTWGEIRIRSLNCVHHVSFVKVVERSGFKPWKREN